MCAELSGAGTRFLTSFLGRPQKLQRATDRDVSWGGMARYITPDPLAFNLGLLPPGDRGRLQRGPNLDLIFEFFQLRCVPKALGPKHQSASEHYARPTNKKPEAHSDLPFLPTIDDAL
jgi:hypothetical protein